MKNLFIILIITILAMANPLSKKKIIFLKTIIPLIKECNKEILNERNKVFLLFKNKDYKNLKIKNLF